MSFASAKSKPPTIPKDKLVSKNTVTVPKPPSFTKPLASSFRQALAKSQDGQAGRPSSVHDVTRKLSSGKPGAGKLSAGQIAAERIIDSYEVVEPLYTSALGTEVCIACHRRTGEPVVLKAIDRSKHVGKTSPMAAAVYHAQVEHEHVCALHEIFDSERLVLVQEFVQGITLDNFMLNHGCGPVEAQQIGQQLASAIMHAHSVG